MPDLIQLLILIDGTGWRIVALFEDAEVCEAVAKLMRMGWQVRAECDVSTGA